MQPTNDHTQTDQPTDRRVTVAEAATLLGLSEEAVRSRLKRGTLRKEKTRDGTVVVVLGAEGSSLGYGRPTNGIDRPTSGQPTDPSAQTELVEALRDQVSFLRQQLEQEREANRENRRIIAGLVQRVPELEAAPEPRESLETATEEATEGDAPPEPTKRSWLYRFFFGP
jgi:predicted ArsR family transcriptional regulator